MTASKLVLVIFIVGVSVTFSAVIDPTSNQFNTPQILEKIILQGARIQKPTTSISTARISSNGKDNSELEILGGYRPLFPPYFPLKNPYANNKVYFDQEYYTRGTDELLLDNGSQNPQNIVKILSQPAIPLIQSPQTSKNARIYKQISTFRSSSAHSAVSSSVKNIQYLPSVIAAQSNFNNKNNHDVTFITF